MDKLDMAQINEEVMCRRLRMLSLLIYQQKELIGEIYWGTRRRINVQSVTKSVTGLAVGIALEEGILSLSEKPADIFRDSLEPGSSPMLEDLTLEHLLKMATGHDRNKPILHYSERDDIKDWIRYSINLPVTEQPGKRFLYDNTSPYLLSAAISLRSGKSMLDWLKPRLFDPLEIPNPQWFHCPAGRTAGFGGLFLAPEEMAKIGQLYLNEGMWKNRRLVSAEWIREAVAKHLPTDLPEDPPMSHPLANTAFSGKDAASGYGYLIWQCAEGRGYRAHGNYGQNIVVLPQKQAVVVTTADEDRGQELLDLIWTEIYPRL